MPLALGLVTGSEGLTLTMGESARAGKRVGCIAIVVVAAVTLGLSVHHDLQLTANATTAKSIANQEAQLRQEECLYKAIRLMVPHGATVYVTAPRFPPTQRLAELSTLWAVPEANIARAQWRLTLIPARGHSIVPFPVTKTRPDPARGQCSGVTLEVRRL
jgi:hypothetical protein